MNYDGIDEKAYLKTLSSLLLLVQQPSLSSIKEEISHKVFESLEVYIESDKAFLKIQEDLQLNPAKVVAELNNEEDLLLLHLFYAMKKNTLDEKEMANMKTLLKIGYFAKLVTKHGIQNILKPDFNSLNGKGVEKELLAMTITYFALSDLRKTFTKSFAKYAKDAAEENIEVAKKHLSETEISKVNVLLIESLLGETRSEVEINTENVFLVAHAAKHPDLSAALSEPVVTDFKPIKEQIILSLDSKVISKIKNYNEVFKQVEKHYCDEFVKQHWNVKPIAKDDLVRLCDDRGISFDTLQFDENSLLCKNACLSIHCPFFLKTTDKFKRHMGGWQGKFPVGFHRFVKARANQPADKLYA